MKVVLFCGGMGMRLREFSESIPKPMVPIGNRPILWNVMKYYAHFGHTDFILCLGWQGNMIKEYFLNYNECLSNDFVLSRGGSNVRLLSSDIDKWNITFVDTGVSANIGERLKAVEPHLRDEETFLANYSDGLSDFPLPELIDFHHDKQSIATFLAVRPKQSFHEAKIGALGEVQSISPIQSADVWMNGGYFVLQREVFNFIEDGEEFVTTPFQRLIQENRLHAIKYNGYWGCMDTFKEKQELDEMVARSNTPWQVWKHRGELAPTSQPPADAAAPMELLRRAK